MSSTKYKCPCCGNYTYDEKPDGNYDICPVCFWEDDPLAYADPDEECCCNRVSLNQARKNYAAFGACRQDMLPHVRKPNSDEKKQDVGEVSVSRTENVELTALCLIRKGNQYLLQDRVKKDWKGYTLPGGHVEPGESIVDAIVREMKEETGLTIRNPKLCGVKQFPIENGRYLVFLFTADEFTGEIVSSEEGTMHWVSKDDLEKVNLVNDFMELLQVMLDENLNEFQYVIEDGKWNIVLK